MANGADKQVIELITSIVILDFMSVVEGEDLGSLHNERGRVNPGLRLPTAPTSYFPQTVRALEFKAGHRRTMLGLLQEDLCPVLSLGFEGLS